MRTPTTSTIVPLDPPSLRPGGRLPPPEPAAGTAITRVLLAGVAFAALLVGAAMVLVPGSTGRYFSWELSPPALAGSVGAFYIASAVVFGWAALRKGWLAQRGLCVAVLGLAGPTLVATALHHDVFDFRRWQAVAWVVLFGVSLVSFGTLVLLRPRPPTAAGAVLGRRSARAFGAVAVAYAATAVVLWAEPTAVAHHGPIDAGPLGLRFIGSWAAFLAICAAHAAWHRRADEARMTLAALVAFPVAALLAAGAHADGLRSGPATTWYLAALGLLAALPAGIAVATRPRVVTPRQPA